MNKFEFKRILKMLSVELIVLVCIAIAFVMVALLKNNHFIKVVCEIEKYFNKDRLSLICNISFILIGIYATITSVFGVSRNKAVDKLAEKDLTNNFIIIISSAMISAFGVALYIVFANFNTNLYIVLLGFIIIEIYSLIRFLVLIILMYYHNIDSSIDINNEEKEQHEKLMDILTEIKIEIQNKNKK